MKVQHIAIEGKCFFINADMIIRRSSYPSDLQEYNIVSKLPGLVCRGGSCIIDSYGHYLTKPVWEKETIIYAELDMNLPAACKMEHDISDQTFQAICDHARVHLGTGKKDKVQ